MGENCAGLEHGFADVDKGYQMFYYGCNWSAFFFIRTNLLEHLAKLVFLKKSETLWIDVCSA